jgi:hypothetical protein
MLDCSTDVYFTAEVTLLEHNSSGLAKVPVIHPSFY